MTVLIFDRLSNNVLDTICSFSFVSSTAFTNGLSNLKITHTVSAPNKTPIPPYKGEKKSMAINEEKNLVMA
jgi:hypothetical protein